jgi:hypothetical protein
MAGRGARQSFDPDPGRGRERLEIHVVVSRIRHAAGGEPAAQESDSMAVAALVCGFLSNLCCCFGLVFAVLGLVFSIIVLSRPETGPGQKGRPLAVIGLVLSLIGLLWHGLLPLLFGFPGAWSFHHFRGWRM